MPKLLRQTTTGHIYVWTQPLSERPDMEPYEPQKTEPATEEPNKETPAQNPECTADPELESAIETFRREVTKPGRKKGIK
jgi:hypothetical protein